MMRSVLLSVIALSFVAAPLAQQAPARFPADRFKAHVAFLADDLLEGRKTGSVGHEIAARYVASQFAAYGLSPGGEDGWYQRVTFQRTTPVAGSSSVTVSGPKGEQRWPNATEILTGPNPRELKLDVAAPLVFVGYGIENERLKIDDYRGLDVKGRIVVVLTGYPKGLPTEEGAHLTTEKAVVAERHGAVGIVAVQTLQSMKTFPWKRAVETADEPDFNWVGPDGVPFVRAPGVRAGATLNTPAAEAVFAGAPRTLDALRREADRIGGAPRGFPLKTKIRIQSEATAERITSPNVVAILRGSDPRLASEYVVLSAHLDHIGVNPPRLDDKPDTDRINNGALDNAAGIATLLEVARVAAAAPDKPRRSIVFLASTAEEEGLRGADYYARHPTVPIKAIRGNVDLDMPLLLYPFTDVTAFGANHSSLGPLVAHAAESMGVKLGEDPMPEEGIFTRSDHYMFVQQGVPAVFLATGFANGGAKAWSEFLSGPYHHPGDDLQQKIDWDSGARFADVNYRITRAMADGDQPPLWYEGDFFGDAFAPGAPRVKRP